MSDSHLSNLTNCKYAKCKTKWEMTWWNSFSKRYDDSLLLWRVQRCSWFYHVTHDYHIDKLKMIQFTYNSCLLYIIDRICMSIINMQTDDILILIDQLFVVVEIEAIDSAKIMIKTREQLNFENALKFNDTRIERIESNDAIYFR
jgi:hypothetical protein